MSKMRMPEMNVVRFNESDVIVASIRSLSVVKAGDGEPGNWSILYESNYYGVTQQKKLNDLYSAFYDNTGINISGSTAMSYERRGVSGTTSIEGLSTIDNQTAENRGVDGWYYWRNGQFHSYSQ